MQDLRCAMILNASLPPGKATNAAAVIALTLGQRHPALVGAALEDVNARHYPGLIPVGIPVLAASIEQLNQLQIKCEEMKCDVVVFPEQGQTTTDYLAFSNAIRLMPSVEWRLLGLAVVGEKKTLRKLTAKLNLFS
ncbi:MAG: DUF2000 domain-containing protein [Enterobacterales bacterium endosymbiont of Blomia tropicalis]|uniref:DUF2000 domain-containing protein n=1 Tax=Mixta mediterraneensis TaxID=2758443 RepID=UPI0025A80B8F|nr:DUF2000 domain-containing protein [Mixta mediterraneensis]MDL4914578.1 DUF2000 domain-containing protein [Mixta mediterraneensis]